MSFEPSQMTVNRRGFLRNTIAAGGAVALAGRTAAAADPPQRPGPAHMKLSLAAYSFNSVLPKSWTPDQIGQAKMTLEELVRQLGLVYADALRCVALYGSAARGERVDGRADLNVLVIVDSVDMDHLRAEAAVARHRHSAV